MLRAARIHNGAAPGGSDVPGHLHLLTDAGERVVMVQTYLSLTEGDHLASKEDRQLILQVLFRPAADGIVKDEGMPFSLAEAFTRTGEP